mgnify:CR=1 FL=1
MKTKRLISLLLAAVFAGHTGAGGFGGQRTA